MLKEPTAKSRKRIEGKGIQPEAQRALRTRNPQARYNFSEDEEGAEEEIQGYLCVSADPRRSGQTEGGENFIITAEELRRILKGQCEEEDQTVWMTTAQQASRRRLPKESLTTTWTDSWGNLQPDISIRRSLPSSSSDNRNW